MRENLFPLGDQAARDGLGADVHEAPLVELVVLEPDRALLEREKDVLHPRHEQPHDRALLGADGVEDALGRHAAQEHGLRPADEAAEPVHLGAGVVERRDAQKDVVTRLAVVLLLHLRRLREAAVMMQDGLGKARRAAREVDGGVLVFRKRDHGVRTRAVGGELAVVLREGRAVLAHVEQQAMRLDGRDDLLDAPGELRAEDEDVDVGLVHAVLDFGRGVAEVERHDRGAAFEDAEVDGQPLEAVHEQDGDLVALLDATRDEQVGKAVALLVEDAPSDLAPVGLGLGALDEVVVAPGDVLGLADLRVDFDEGYLVAVCSCIAAQKIDNRHVADPSYPRRFDANAATVQTALHR